MKVFQEVQKNFIAFGIVPNQSKLNGKLAVTWLVLSLSTTLSASFLVFDAETFQEYTTSIYLSSGGAMAAALFTITIFKMEKLFKLKDVIETTINESELILKLLNSLQHPE